MNENEHFEGPVFLLDYAIEKVVADPISYNMIKKCSCEATKLLGYSEDDEAKEDNDL